MRNVLWKVIFWAFVPALTLASFDGINLSSCDCKEQRDSTFKCIPADDKERARLGERHNLEGNAAEANASSLNGAGKSRAPLEFEASKLQAKICESVGLYRETLARVAHHHSATENWARKYAVNKQDITAKTMGLEELRQKKRLEKLAETLKNAILQQQKLAILIQQKAGLQEQRGPRLTEPQEAIPLKSPQYYPALRQKLGLNIRQKLKKLRKILTRS